MKVRLKRHTFHLFKTRQFLFQFHEGPIKTHVAKATNLVGTKFQFHEGPIKTISEKKLEALDPCFNSMKVRLKPDLMHVTRSSYAFQFHEGPIKTICLLWVIILIICFNSMKVRLKPIAHCCCLAVIAFQFHEGPIKTVNSIPSNRASSSVSIP